jgi:hypothetical protein
MQASKGGFSEAEILNLSLIEFGEYLEAAQELSERQAKAMKD